ncbi:MAG: hypothetical protein HKN47_17790, partial [Pirellulaceae bacterium]|nr:hypothetical protein [Pirellulaceae bacterium]
MNRQTLLQCIQRHVRESITDDGDARPLGEVVGSVLAEIQPNGAGQAAEAVVIPIAMVAAFVDGDLTTVESEAVCQAAINDRSVVAELVSAVRAKEQHSRSIAGGIVAGTDELDIRLLQMGLDFARSQRDTGELAHDEYELQSTPSIDPQDAAGSGPIIRVKEAKVRDHRGRHRSLLWLGAFAAIAASAILVFYLRNQDIAPDQRQIVEVPRDIPVPPPERTNAREIKVDSPDLRQPNDSAPSIVNSPDRASPDGSLTDAVPASADELQPMIVDDARPPNRPVFDPNPSPSAQAPRPAAFAGIRWKRITGILAQEKSNTTSTRSAAKWSSLGEGMVSFGGSSPRDLVIRTLP